MRFVIAIALLSIFATPAPFATSAGVQLMAAPDDELDDLKQKFEDRYPQIVKLKSAGTVGETSEGFLDWVKEKSSDAAGLVEDENADRRRLYELIAQKENTSADKVAQRNAQRNFEKARKGEWLKKDGKWVQK